MPRKDKMDDIISELEKVTSVVNDFKSFRVVIDETLTTMTTKLEEINKKINAYSETTKTDMEGMNSMIQENSKRLENFDSDAIKKLEDYVDKKNSHLSEIIDQKNENQYKKLTEIENAIVKPMKNVTDELANMKKENKEIKKSVDSFVTLKKSFKDFISAIMEMG